ncbi:MAG: hypothetical protein LBT40_11610 [Deltaproteobacteria bacterium]|jgi:hypothetical protein|nr:hypothetical protein [Deltaproteobacteria bacterium]
MVATGRDDPEAMQKAFTFRAGYILRESRPAMESLPEEKAREESAARHVEDLLPNLNAAISELKVIVNRVRLFDERVRAPFFQNFGDKTKKGFAPETFCASFVLKEDQLPCPTMMPKPLTDALA